MIKIRVNVNIDIMADTGAGVSVVYSYEADDIATGDTVAEGSELRASGATNYAASCAIIDAIRKELKYYDITVIRIGGEVFTSKVLSLDIITYYPGFYRVLKELSVSGNTRDDRKRYLDNLVGVVATAAFSLGYDTTSESWLDIQRLAFSFSKAYRSNEAALSAVDDILNSFVSCCCPLA